MTDLCSVEQNLLKDMTHPFHKLVDQMRRVSRRGDPSQSFLFLVVISNCPLLSGLGDKIWGSGDSLVRSIRAVLYL